MKIFPPLFRYFRSTKQWKQTGDSRNKNREKWTRYSMMKTITFLQHATNPKKRTMTPTMMNSFSMTSTRLRAASVPVSTIDPFHHRSHHPVGKNRHVPPLIKPKRPRPKESVPTTTATVTMIMITIKKSNHQRITTRPPPIINRRRRRRKSEKHLRPNNKYLHQHRQQRTIVRRVRQQHRQQQKIKL